MWWRAEVLGPDVDLTKLGEDEVVNIMERPTLFQDRRLARSIALEFLSRVDAGRVDDRMRLMREATKRLLRLTPFVALSALSSEEIATLVGDVFDVAAAGMTGRASSLPLRAGPPQPSPDPDVVAIPSLSIAARPASVEPDATGSRQPDAFEEVAQAALDIVARTGRVTNLALREIAPITPEEAREVLKTLVERGQLVRRGVKRGTHYVLPETSHVPPDPVSSNTPMRPAPKPRPSETALRRLLRRGR
jgi:hypothetical protein